ncbi:heat-inducible transcriptional repressor HrcA [Adlercreutzia sp. ZJ138]|uniref:heat-inducible transcriptional repressor HrcA n=1 Tax=Adlercreutzia sp. ZJ138 TaxID=2709405 RepID=UPI0013EAC558|nr:heat-inducible transcriptional repressor HrcA [Adlercreutzia sp. ZJ138]
MLSDRRQRVLAALIEEYVARALPVGSRTLVEQYQLGVSSATVRNELSVLEEDGYITQPHTSAGRIPTDYGYRAFVDRLFQQGLLPQESPYAAAVERMRASAAELDSLLEQTSLALSRFTDCLSIVIAPSVMDMRIKQISVISLSPRKALVVVVTEDARVFNRQMEFSTDISPDDLARVQTLLAEMFSERSLHEMEERLAHGFSTAVADPLVRMVLEEVLSCLQEGELSRARRLGVSSLLSKPEFSHSQSLIPVMEVLEDDTVLLQIFDDAAHAGGALPTVHIGSENVAAGLSGVSVVASSYGEGAATGVVAVVGPTRMDYSKVIHAVQVASAALQDR